MAIVAYARVSSAGQSLEVQTEELAKAGYDKLFAEKHTGTTTTGRDELERALDYVREGDTLVVTRIDRLARSISDFDRIIKALEAKGVGFRAVQQAGIDTTTIHGKLMLNILASFAEFETQLRKERQFEGVAKAKAKGVYKGRPKSLDDDRIRAMKAEGMGASQIAKTLGVGRASVYRALA